MIFHTINDKVVLAAVRDALASIPPNAPVHDLDIEIYCTKETDALLDVNIVDGSVRRQDEGSYIVTLRRGIRSWEAFWLALHELAHIALGHCDLSLEMRSGDVADDLERQANGLASRWSGGLIAIDGDTISSSYATVAGENLQSRPYWRLRYRKDVIGG